MTKATTLKPGRKPVKVPAMKSNVLSLPFAEGLTPTSYELPKELSADQWLDVGKALGKADRSLMWWIGDWWTSGETSSQHGDMINIVQSEDWEGPGYQTCMDAAWVCKKFKTTSRRREVFSFAIHREVAALDEKSQDDVLDWAWNKGMRRKVSDIRQRVKQLKAYLAQGWTTDQLDRKNKAEEDKLCVVANMREVDGRRVDEALLSWAEGNDLFVRIDRKSEWGNPFEMPDDGNREEVVAKFSKFYLPHKDGLLSRIPTLRGKVLGCWCHPAECHGHLIAEVVNREATGEASAVEIADMIAEVDG